FGAAGFGSARFRRLHRGTHRVARARDHRQAADPARPGFARSHPSAAPAASLPVDARRHGCRGTSRSIWRCDLRRGPKRVRVLRHFAGGAYRQGDGRRGAPSWPPDGHAGHRQGDVQDSVIVQKYGGTSVGTAARIRRVSHRIAETVRSGEKVVAVVSAMGHTTDRLIALAQSVNAEPPARELDMLVANGETITAPLVAMSLE